MPVLSLIPNYKAGDELSISEATVDAMVAMPNLNSASATSSKRSIILWVVLLLGVLALAGVAWSVTKQLRNNK
ncbi:MAG: DUF3999 family protein [Methylophilaceae bacterium]|nr:DUF3999 family protein [Methylophilaceae bacterium]